MTTPHEQTNPTVYVLGFAFTTIPRPGVCLIHKKKPEWQAGKLNGVGGKCEHAETPHQAMAREFREETGVIIDSTQWLKFHTMRFGNGAIVHCFTVELPDDQTPVTQEIEEIEMFAIGAYGRWYRPNPIMPNLNWLVPMAYHELHVSPSERMTT